MEIAYEYDHRYYTEPTNHIFLHYKDYHTTHASFLREPGGADPLRPARRSIYPGSGEKPLRRRTRARGSLLVFKKCLCGGERTTDTLRNHYSVNISCLRYLSIKIPPHGAKYLFILCVLAGAFY